MTISDTEVFKRAEIPPKDLSDEGKCLLAAQEEANATQTYLNMADNTDDEALKANFEEVAGDEMEHLGKNLMSAAHIRPELAEHMINGAQEAESEGFDIDQAIKDRFAREDAKKAESTDFDEAIQEHVKRSYPSEEAKIDEILYEMFSKAKANGATYISDQFLGWLKDTESFKKAYEREQIGEYDINSPGMQRFRSKIDRDKKYVDKLDKKFNLEEMYDDLQKMYSVNELKQAEKELLDLKKKMLAESRGISDKDMRDHYNNLLNKYNEIQKMRAYNEYIDVRAQIKRMEKLLEHVDDLSIPGMQGFRIKIDRNKKYVDKLDKEFNLKKMYDSSQKMYSVKELEQAEKEYRDLNNKIFAESKEIKDKDMRDQYNNLLNKYNEIQKMRVYNEYIDVRAQIKRMEKLLEHVDDLSIPGMQQRFRSKIDRDKKYVDKLDKEFNLKKMYDSPQRRYSVKELEQAKKELRDLNKDLIEMSGYNKLANKYNEIQKMRAYNKYIGVGAQTERMEKLLELINDFVEKINEAFGDKIDERLANTEGENVYETKWGGDDPEKVIEDYNSVVEEAFKDPDVKEIMDKIGALGFNPRQIITEVLGGSEDMDIEDLLRSRLGSSPESVGKMLRDITESYASGIGQSSEESRKIQEIANRNKGDVYFPESKNKNIYGGVNYNRLGVKSDPRVDALATIMAEVENNYKTRKYGGKTTPIDRETFTPGQKHRQMAFDLMSILGYLFDENDPIRIFDRSKGSKYDLSNLDLLTNKDDTYQKIANEIESAMKGAKKDRLWALMKDPVQPSSLDSIQKWSVGDGMNLGMGWVRDAIYKFAEDVANGNIDLPIPKNKPEGETGERYESAKKAVDELKAGEPMTYGRMQDILGYEATGDAFVNSLNDSNMFGTALNVIRPQLYDEVEKFIGSDGTKRDLLVEKSLPDSNVRDRYLAIMDAIRRKVASKNHLKSFPSLRDVLDAVYEITTNDIKRQRIPSNISDFRKVITLKDKFKNIVDALTAYSSFENISGLKSTYDELENGVNSLGYKSQKNKKNTKQLRDILDIISKPNFTLSDLSEDQMNYLKTQNIIGSDEGEHTAEDFKKNLIRMVKNAIAKLANSDTKQLMGILDIISKPNFTLSDLSEDQMNYLKTHNIIGSDEGEHTNSDTTTAKDFKKNLIRMVKNAIAKLANSNTKPLIDILDIISKPNFTLSDLSEDQMNYLKIHDIIGSDEGETAEDFKKNLIRMVKNAIANSNAEYLLKENKSNLEYVLRTALGSRGAKLFTELIKIANDKNYLDALDEFERTGSTKKYGWDKSIQVPLGSRDGKTISVPLYEVLNSGLMQNFDKIYDTVMAAVGPVDKNNPVYEGDNSMLMNILQRNKLRRDDKKYVNESNKDRFGYIPLPEYEGKNLDKGEIFALYNDPEKRDEFPLSKKFKAEEYLPSYLRLKGSDLSMSDEFLSSLVFRNRKFSPEEIARITTSDFNTRHIRDIADALSKGQELNETDKALVKLFGIGDMGFESLSNLVKNIDSNTFKKYEESIKKNGYKSVIEDLENKSKTDKSVVEDLELLKATYELINKARNIDDDVRAIYEESVDDFEKRLNEAGESIYEILGSEGAYDKLVQMGEKLYTDFQKEVDYSEDLKKRKTEGDKIKFLERVGVPIGYKDRTGDIRYFKQGDATQADLQRYFNEMYKNYLDDDENMGLRDRLNEYDLHDDQDDFVPIKGWSDSSMRLTKKHPLRNISVANALISAMGWEDLDPTKLVMSNKWLKDVDPDRDEISIVKNILDGYVDYFTGDVESEPKSLLNSLWNMGDNIPSEIEVLDANGRAIEEMNESNKKDNTDQEGEDERYDSLEDLIASNLQARINNARGERAAQQKKKSYEEATKRYEKDKKKQEENNGAKEGVDKMNDETEATTKSAAKIMNAEGAKTRILDPNLDSEGIHTGKVFPSWQKDSYVISMCDPNVENIPPKPPEISNAQPEGATMKTWDIDEAIKERQK